jgi:hypothetical protein
MKRRCVLRAFLCLALWACLHSPAAADHCTGVVRGIVVDAMGRPVSGFHIQLDPMIRNGDYIKPEGTTDDSGHFHFELLCAHAWAVMPSFDQPDYPIEGHWHYQFLYPKLPLLRTDTAADDSVVEVRINLPPPPALLRVHVFDQRTGAALTSAKLQVIRVKRMHLRTFGPVGTFFNGTVTNWAIPSDEDLTISVMASGYRKWRPHGKRGQRIHAPSGARVSVEVALVPLDR